ncbi:transcription factor bHLH95-like [Prosopis cineraria]|uniref:transcription factor bHLH95-like n=1 Tax=Prosopis cineraria TaxID=364024 RepID=UPI00240EB552|nr:transcription factor bHLH95-like [Prosopis cineraria]
MSDHQEEQTLSNSDNSGEISTADRSLRGKRAINTVDGGEDHRDHQSHASSERERRKRMRLYLRELQTLVPSVHHVKADKATIVEETMKYIKTLEDTLENLEKLKRERLRLSASNLAFYYPTGNVASGAFTTARLQGSSSCTANPNPIGLRTWIFPNVVVNICGEDAQFSMCFPNKEGLYSAIYYALQKHNIQVLSANISSDDYNSSYKIQARLLKANNSAGALFSVEETFKEAARDIYLLSPV